MILEQEQTNKPKEEKTVFRAYMRGYYTVSAAPLICGERREWH